ncbi:hypothetical protein E2R68_12785 [Psychromonas sp. RZ22]|uniref:hypothetical protein n=1 Tax=Psychromonas algarum TaxID=2555643 RepID=UPI0010688C3F|nr:hypothetical protein [Psychromonas sp. RZ22]TEW53357.1 hypothetical protein E2R68_12785 [Psychromonas sp. RZ22]
MADLHVKEKLTPVDIISIISYRTGMVVTVFALIALALQQLYYPFWYKYALVWLALSVFLQAANLHIYNKNIRYILVTSAWLGVWLISLSLISSGIVIAHLSLLALLICCAGISYKESLCFSLPILKVNPLLLIAFAGCLILSLHLYAAILALLSAILTGYMAYKKIRMPLHHDLGDRSKYEV